MKVEPKSQLEVETFTALRAPDRWSAALAAERAAASGRAVRAVDLAGIAAALGRPVRVCLVLAVERFAELALHLVDVRGLGLLGAARGRAARGGAVSGGALVRGAVGRGGLACRGGR